MRDGKDIWGRVSNSSTGYLTGARCWKEEIVVSVRQDAGGGAAEGVVGGKRAVTSVAD